MRNYFFPFLLIAFLSVQVFAQNKQDYPCVLDKLYEANPELKPENNPKAKALLDEFTKKYKSAVKSTKADPILRIPVVFHVVHNGGTENISDSQIQEALVMVNEDYSGQNNRRSGIHSNFLSLEANVGFQFELANYDPEGYATSGITRTQSLLTENGGQIELKELIQWPREKYLNIWVVSSSDGSSGSAFAFLPPSVADRPVFDGIVNSHWAIGRTGTAYTTHLGNLTHEIGHWANLEHIWGSDGTAGDAGNCSQDDGISDTPNTLGSGDNGLCGTNVSTCGSQDNISNFMDYACEVMYTHEQRSVMRAALNSPVSGRNNLWTSTNLQETGLAQAPVHALFKANVESVEPGSSVNYTNESTVNSGGSITSWQWSFQGGSPSSYNGQNPPAITYSTKGVYEVTLTVSNNSGSDTRIRKEQIDVNYNYIMTNGATVTTDEGWFYDSGFKGNYSNDESKVMTIQPATSGKVIEIDFFDFSMEADDCKWDYLEVFDGTSTSATLIGKYCGKAPEPTIRATNAQGALTFRFASDDNTFNPGWRARIQAVDPGYVENTYLMGSSASVTTCSGVFYDSGKNLVYSVSENSTMTFLPATSEAKITADFLEFLTEGDGCQWDYLEIFNGNSVNSTLIGKYCGTNSPGTVTSTNSNGALTFRFVSDDNTVFSGWKANINCGGGDPCTDPITAPGNLSSTGKTTTTISLSWTASTGGVSPCPALANYNVYRNSTLVGSPTNTSFTDNGLNPNTSYTYTVKAEDANGGETGASNSLSITTEVEIDTESPTVPTGFTYSNVTANSVYLSWNASTDNFGVTGYDVKQGTAIITTTTGTNYQVTGLTPSTNYEFAVRAKDAADNNSDWTSPVYITTGSDTDVTPPSAPTNLISTSQTGTTISLSWGPSTDNVAVTDYNVYNGGVLADNVSGTTATIIGLTAGNEYTFTVKARDAATNESGASNVLTVSTDPGSICEAGVCALTATDQGYEWITGVQIGTYSKTSAKESGGYSDFTAEIIQIAMPTTLDIVLTPNNTQYTEHFKVWIDYNGDCNFDNNEEVLSGSAQGNTTGTITPNTTNGAVRLRVAMQYNAAPPSSCGEFQYGEVEDYTIEIVGDIPDPPTPPTNLTASNVTVSSVDLTWDASTSSAGVTGYDVYDGNTIVSSVSITNATINNLAANTSYTFTVKAKDTFGNESAASNAVNVTTLDEGCTEPPTAPVGIASSNITTSSVDLTWQEVIAPCIGETVSYDVYQGATFIKNVSGTSTTITGLDANTTYIFTIRAKDSAGNVSTPSNEHSVTTDTNGGCTNYCASSGENQGYEWITGVQVGSFSKTSAKENAGYSDFTTETINLSAGSSVSVTLTPNTTQYTEHFKVWIDYNNDCTFDDAGEEVLSGSAQGNTTGTINVPSGASGTVRMRVAMQYNAAPPSCETYQYGEVEDYTVIISGAAKTALAESKEVVEISPNPTNGIVQIKTNKNGIYTISVSDFSGKVVKMFTGEGEITTIDLNDLSAGMYLVNVEGVVEKLIKK